MENMSVKELIRELHKFDENMEVLMEAEGQYGGIFEVVQEDLRFGVRVILK